MPGTITSTKVAPGRRGVLRLNATLTGDADGVVTAQPIGIAYGRIGAFIFPDAIQDNFFGQAIITLRDDSGAALLTIDTDQYKFGNLTEGDTDGGASADIWTTGAAHGLVVGDVINFIALTGNTTAAGKVAINVPYAVKTQGSATTFVLSATPLAAGAVLDIGATDVTASSWVKRGGIRYIRPAAIVTNNAGAAYTPHNDGLTQVHRDILVAGRIYAVAEQLGVSKSIRFSVIVDETPARQPGAYA